MNAERVSVIAVICLSLVAGTACVDGRSSDADAGAPAIASRDQCLVDGIGSWTVQGTLPANTCPYDNPSPRAWSSVMTVSVFGTEHTIEVDDSELGSTARAFDKPALLYSNGRCVISGYLVTPWDSITDFAFEFESATQGTLAAHLAYDSCESSINLAVVR